MENIGEFDHLISLDSAGMVELEGDVAMGDRLAEWFKTPEGTFLDLPAWGHPLYKLKHEPTGLNLNILAEMMILEKLPKDIRNLNLRSASVDFREIDLFYLRVEFSSGVFEQEVTL